MAFGSLTSACIEKLNVKFQYLPTSDYALHKVGHWLDDPELDDRSGWNAVFLSPGGDWKQDGEQYKVIRTAIWGAHNDRLLKVSSDSEYAVKPVDLAISMDRLQMGIGFVFPEDTSIVVWPLGRKRDRNMVVLAQRRRHHWTYCAIRLLHKDVSPEGRSWQPAYMLHSRNYAQKNYIADFQGSNAADKAGSHSHSYGFLESCETKYTRSI